MKKIFLIALVGLFAIASTENANANTFDTDNDIVLTVGDYDTQTDVIALQVVAVATEFVENVAVFTVNNINLGGVFVRVSIDSGEFVNNFNILTLTNSNTFIDVPIEYGIYSTNEFKLNEPIPNLNEYVKEYNLNEHANKTNYTNGYVSPEIVKDIETNVGKLTN